MRRLVVIAIALLEASPAAHATLGPQPAPPNDTQLGRAQFWTFRGPVLSLAHEPGRTILDLLDESGQMRTVELETRTAILKAGRVVTLSALAQGQLVEIRQAIRPDGVLTQIVTILDPNVPAAGPTDEARIDQNVAAAALADDANDVELATAYSWHQKLYRGVMNVLTGVLEIPRNVWIMRYEHGPAAGMTLGLAKGLVFASARMLAGAYEAVTFPVPLPLHYRPVVRPEFVWEAGDVNLLELRELWTQVSGG